MSKRKQEKRNRRSKEKAKERRRTQGASPLARLAGEEAIRCWLDRSTDQGGGDRGLSTLVVTRGMRGGAGSATAHFLIDHDAIGLKDAFARFNIEAAEVRELLQNGPVAFKSVSVEKARQLVASALRWTRAHPFRLPPGTERALAVLGGALDIDNAPIDDFGTADGGMYYIGRRRDLERALQGVTLEEFMERDDVETTFLSASDFDDDADFEDEDEAVDDDEGAEEMQNKVLRTVTLLEPQVRKWCADRNTPVPDLLTVALGIMVSANVLTLTWASSGESPADASEKGSQYVDDMIDELPEAVQAQAADAVDLVTEFVQAHPDAILKILEVVIAQSDEGAADFEEDLDTAKTFADAAIDLADRLTDAVRRWCFANARLPEPRLSEVVSLQVMELLAAYAEDAPSEEVPEIAQEKLTRLLEQSPPEDHDALQRAYDQVTEFLRSLSKGELMKMMGT